MRTLCSRPRRRLRSGFTLIELLISAMIAILIFGIGFAIMNGAMLARAHASGRIQSTESARILFDRLRADLDGAIVGPWTAPTNKSNLVRTAGSADQLGPTLVLTTPKNDYAQAQIDAFEAKLAALSFTVTIDTDLAVSSMRYYCMKDGSADGTGTMHREISLLQPPGVVDPFHYRPVPASEPESALFPGVSGFEAVYWRWNTTTRVLEGPYSIANPLDVAEIPTCTHLEVTLTFLDPNKKLADRVRTFRELLVLPEALK